MLQLADGVSPSSWPAQAGHPRLSFDAISKVVDGAAKPRHDDKAKAAPDSIHLLPGRPLGGLGPIGIRIRLASVRCALRGTKAKQCFCYSLLNWIYRDTIGIPSEASAKIRARSET